MSKNTEEENELIALKHARKYIRGDITKSYNKLSVDIDTLGTNEIETSIDRLSKLQSTIEDADKRILNVSIACGVQEEVMQKEYDECVNYTNKLLSILNLLRGKLKSINAPQIPNVGSNANIADRMAHSKLKLPQIPLPTYAHKDGEDLHKFFSNFESIVLKYGLSDYEQFRGNFLGNP